MGKTFLLQKIKQDSKENFIVSYVDVSRIVGKNDTQLKVQHVLLELLDEMNNSIHEILKDNNKITFLLKNLLTI